MPEERSGAIADAEIVDSDDTLTASAGIRTTLAAHHLEAAAKAARRVHEVEAENAGAERGGFVGDIMQHASVSVVMAAAALEANVNETVSDILDGIAPLTITRARRELLADLRGRMVGPEEKYRHLALLLDKTPDRGGAAWQDVLLLTRLRNDLMHFKPAWDDEAVHARMLEMMRRRLGVSRFYRGGFVYPHGFLAYGTARWAVRTVLAFAACFSALVGVEDRFRNTGFDYGLPGIER